MTKNVICYIEFERSCRTLGGRVSQIYTFIDKCVYFYRKCSLSIIIFITTLLIVK